MEWWYYYDDSTTRWEFRRIEPVGPSSLIARGEGLSALSGVMEQATMGNREHVIETLSKAIPRGGVGAPDGSRGS